MLDNTAPSPTRRQFLASSTVTIGALSACAGTTASLESLNTASSEKNVECLDYGRSFLCNPSPHNAVRFWIESRTTLFDDKNGTSTHFYQCASCKSEDTFAKRNLLKEDNHDFMPIFGDDDWLIFRRHARITTRYRQLAKAKDLWGEPILKLHAAKPLLMLDTWEKIRDVTAEGLPLITRTEISNTKTGLRAIIECPTKSMNISLEKSLYQVDTGPIVFPDLTKRYDSPINCLRLAFIVFNAPHFADFVIEQPTPVVENGVERCRVYHYSKPFSMAAKNTVLAMDTRGEMN